MLPNYPKCAQFQKKIENIMTQGRQRQGVNCPTIAHILQRINTSLSTGGLYILHNSPFCTKTKWHAQSQ